MQAARDCHPHLWDDKLSCVKLSNFVNIKMPVPLRIHGAKKITTALAQLIGFPELRDGPVAHLGVQVKVLGDLWVGKLLRQV